MLTEQEFRALAAAVERTWPDGDERGALSLISPEAVSAAAASVTHGRVISCAEPIPPTAAKFSLATRTDAADDWLAVNESIGFEQHGADAMTHFDSLGHFFYAGRGHAGATPEIIGADGISRLDAVPAGSGIVGRGLLLDLPRVTGAPYVGPGTLVHRRDVEAWLAATGTVPQAGDILFVRTGRPLAPQPAAGELSQVGALDLDCAAWLHDNQFALVVSDAGMDPPAALVANVVAPWHVLLLTRMGVAMVDLANLEELAATCSELGRQHFQAVIGVLPLPGATASPVNPLAVL